MNSQCQWTVFIIMLHDGKHFFEVFDLEQSILDVVKRDSVRYIIFLYDQDSETATIRKLLHLDTNFYQFEIVERISGKSLYDKSTLVDFFKMFNSGDDLTDKNMVITWGHGAGLGYYSVLEPDTGLVNYFEGTFLDKEVSFRQEKKRSNKFLSDFAFMKAQLSFDEPSKNVIDILFSNISFLKRNLNLEKTRELRLALEKKLRLITAKQLKEIFSEGFSQKPVDVLLTINCYTQMLETGYELRNNVQLVISPQTTIPFAGINYKKLFNVMEKSPSLGLQEISLNITRNFHKKYQSKRLREIFDKRYPGFYEDEMIMVSISGNFPKVYERLIEILNPVACLFESFYNVKYPQPNKIELVKKARSKCIEVATKATHGIVDLQRFLEVVSTFAEMQTPAIQEFMDEFISIKKECNASWLKAADAFYKPDSNGNAMSPNFLSVFFPFVTSDDMLYALAKIYFENPDKTEFQINASWDDFMQKIYYIG